MPIISISAVLASLILMMKFCSLLAIQRSISAEGARKLVHVSMGMMCLSFPWIFQETQAVVILASIAVLGIILIRTTQLRDQLGVSLFSVKRLSIGELVFPIAVAWLFTMYKSGSHSSAVYYTIPLLLLTLADTIGAIAGTKFGKVIYKTASAQKSVEGSIAFFVTAYTCTFIPLLLFTDQDVVHITLISLILTLFMTAVEGISGMGMDNLLIPIGSYFLLDFYSTIEPHLLWWRVILIVSILGVLIWTRKKHNLNGGTVLTASLLCFISSMLGGIYCLLACLFIFLRHIMAVKNILSEQQRHTHSLDTILSISVPAMTWLTLGNIQSITHELGCIFFILSLAITIGMLHAGTHKFTSTYTHITLKSLVKSIVLTGLLATLCYPLTSHTPQAFSFLFILCIICSGLCAAIFHTLRSEGEPRWSDWVLLCLLTATSTTIIYYSYGHYYPSI